MADEPEGRYWRVPVTITHTFYIDYWSDEATTKQEAAEQASGDPELYELFPSPGTRIRDQVDADWSVDTGDVEWWPGDPNPTYLCPECGGDVKAFRFHDKPEPEIERHSVWKDGKAAGPCAGGGQPAGEPR